MTAGRAKALPLVLAAGLVCFAPAPAYAQESGKSESSRAIAGLTKFAIAYSVWLWEGRCQTLTPAKREAFRLLVADDLLRLAEVFDSRMVSAATDTGRKTSAEGQLATCDKADDMGDFGYDMAKEASESLRSLPRGYRLNVTP